MGFPDLPISSPSQEAHDLVTFLLSRYCNEDLDTGLCHFPPSSCGGRDLTRLVRARVICALVGAIAVAGGPIQCGSWSSAVKQSEN
jgi:hypothetical protein